MRRRRGAARRSDAADGGGAGWRQCRPQRQEPHREKARLVYPGFAIPFVLLVLCFAAWGSAANLTDVLVGVFRSIFDMSNFQSALVQFAYYGAYFSLAIPAAIINRATATRSAC